MKIYYLNFLFIILFIPFFQAVAQEEKLEYKCDREKIGYYVESSQMVKKIAPPEGAPANKHEAEKAGWKLFNTMFGLEGLGVGYIDEAFSPAATKTIAKRMGEIGMGLAFVQYAVDVSKGEPRKAAINLIKPTIYAIIGLTPWSGLKIASIGLQFLETAVKEIGPIPDHLVKDKWKSAYFNYFDSDGIRKSIKQWKTSFENAETEEDIKKIIDNHLDQFKWGAEELGYADSPDKSESSVRNGLGNFDRAAQGPPSDKVKKQIREAYLKERLYPYIKTIFTRRAYEAKQAVIDSICGAYKKTVDEMNRENRVRVRLIGDASIASKCRAGMKVKSDSSDWWFLKRTFNEKNECYFSYTKYSIIKHGIKKAAIKVLCPTDEGSKEIAKEISLNKSRTTLEIELPSSKDSSKTDSSEEITSRKPEAGESKLTEYKKLMSGRLQIEPRPAFSINIIKVKSSSDKYTGRIEGGRFPRKNRLIINKKENILSFIYEPRGMFAPELIAKSSSYENGVYSGKIKTNDKHNVDVGVFHLTINPE